MTGPGGGVGGGGGGASSTLSSVASRGGVGGGVGGGGGGGGLHCFSDQASASSEDEAESVVAASHSEADEAESDVEKQGPFAFRRKLHCSYLAVSFPQCHPFFERFLNYPLDKWAFIPSEKCCDLYSGSQTTEQ